MEIPRGPTDMKYLAKLSDAKLQAYLQELSVSIALVLNEIEARKEHEVKIEAKTQLPREHASVSYLSLLSTDRVESFKDRSDRLIN